MVAMSVNPPPAVRRYSSLPTGEFTYTYTVVRCITVPNVERWQNKSPPFRCMVVKENISFCPPKKMSTASYNKTGATTTTGTVCTDLTRRRLFFYERGAGETMSPQSRRHVGAIRVVSMVAAMQCLVSMCCMQRTSCFTYRVFQKTIVE